MLYSKITPCLVEIIHEELRLKDIEMVEKLVGGLAAQLKRSGKSADKNKVFELETLQKILQMLSEEKKDIRLGDWNNKEVRSL